MPEKITVWITAYALTQGIFEIDGHIFEDSRKIFCGMAIEGGCESYYYGNDWHTTKESAVAKANKMRAMKIESLKKQLKKLEKLEFA